MDRIQQQTGQPEPVISLTAISGLNNAIPARPSDSIEADQLGIGLIITDLCSRTLLVNAYARGLFEHDLQVGHSLPAVLRIGADRWEQAIGAALAGRCCVMRLDRSGPPLRLTMLPCTNPAQAQQLYVLAERQQPGLSAGLEQFAKRYDLTVAETQVFLGLANGRVPKQVARDRNVALSTVRYQVKQILNKTGEPGVNCLVIRAIRDAAMQSDSVSAQ